MQVWAKNPNQIMHVQAHTYQHLQFSHETREYFPTICKVGGSQLHFPYQNAKDVHLIIW